MLVVIVLHPVVSNSLQTHGLQEARPPCPLPSPRVCPSSCSLNEWSCLAISSSDALFSFSPRSFPTSGYFPMSHLFASDDQNIGASASASVLPVNIQGLSHLRLTGLICLLSKGLSEVFSSRKWSRELMLSNCGARSVFIPIPKKGNANECSNYRTIALISHASKWFSKFSKPGFSNMWTMIFQMFRLVLEMAEEPEIKLPASAGSWKKQESSRKTSISALLTMLKPLTVCITINCGKFWKRWEHQTTWPASWETYMQVRIPQLELDMEQQTGSK